MKSSTEGNRVETKVDGKTVVVYEDGKDAGRKEEAIEGNHRTTGPSDPGSTVLVKNAQGEVPLGSLVFGRSQLCWLYDSRMSL